MFRFYFSFLFTILINDLNKFFYSISIKDNKTISKREVIRAMCYANTFVKDIRESYAIEEIYRRL